MGSSLQKKGLVAASDKVILAAEPALELVRLFTTDFSVDAAKKYDVISPKVLSSTASDFAKGTNNYVKEDNTVDYADVRLTNHKKSTYGFDDLDDMEDELAQIWDKLGPKAGRALSKSIIRTVCGVLTYDKREAAKTVKNGLASLGDFTNIRSLTESANYDPEDCVLMLEPETYDKLIALLPQSVVGEGGIVNAGVIGARFGFKAIINAPNISKASGAAVSGVAPSLGVGFVVPSDAIAIAGRYVKPIKGQAGNLIEAGYTFDEKSGIVIGTRVVTAPDDGECYWTSECLFGAVLTKQLHERDGEQVPNGAPGFLQLVTAA